MEPVLKNEKADAGPQKIRVEDILARLKKNVANKAPEQKNTENDNVGLKDKECVEDESKEKSVSGNKEPCLDKATLKSCIDLQKDNATIKQLDSEITPVKASTDLGLSEKAADGVFTPEKNISNNDNESQKNSTDANMTQPEEISKCQEETSVEETSVMKTDAKKAEPVVNDVNSDHSDKSSALLNADLSGTGAVTTNTLVTTDVDNNEKSVASVITDKDSVSADDVALFSMFRNISGEEESMEVCDMTLDTKPSEESTLLSQLTTSEIPDDPSLLTSADASVCNSIMETQSPIGTPATSNKEAEEDSQLSQCSRSSISVLRRRRDGLSGKIVEVTDDMDTEHHEITAEKIFEYRWPDEKGAEYFVLQEQISEYLGVVSFKRKHRDLQRRPVEPKERTFLRDKGIVTEMQCDLGLCALRSEEVYDLMAKDYPEKFKRLEVVGLGSDTQLQDVAEVLSRRERERIRDDHKGYEMPNIDKSKMTSFIKNAVQATADFNAMFNRERREERRAYFDLQTMEVHWPANKYKKLPPEKTKPSAYPVALIPGQFQEYYKSYTPHELKYLPLNSTLFSPPRAEGNIYAPGPDDEENDEAADRKVIESLNKQVSSSDSDSSSDDSDEETTSAIESGPTPHIPAKVPVMPVVNQIVVAPVPACPVTPIIPVVNSPARTPRGKKSKDIPKCHVCITTIPKKKVIEELVQCAECGRHGHPSCLEITEEMIPIIKTYPWQCMECKTCVKCMDSGQEDKMMFCDHCDRGYHTFCVKLRTIPTGRWECPSCRFGEAGSPKKRRRRAQKSSAS